MRLLLLIPNFILLTISVYNFSNELNSNDPANYLAYKVLHVLVMLLCIGFISIIVKSLFAVKYNDEVEVQLVQEEESYEELNLQHS